MVEYGYMKSVSLENKKTKIVATLGPASLDPVVIKEMIEEGTNMFRINASHSSDPQGLVDSIRLIRKCAKECNRYSGVFVDLQGPKIRVGTFENDAVKIDVGQEFRLTSEDVVGTSTRAMIDYKTFIDDVKVGDLVFINDGKIRLKIVDIDGPDAVCIVQRGGELSNRKGVNLPFTKMSVSPFTTKDEADVRAVLDEAPEYIALSFISSAEDIDRFRTFLKENGGESIGIISKVERQLAVDNLNAIIEATDAVMVARGDLGVEIGVENVPQVQRRIIRECNKHVKPVIVATQMLESMITSEVATRAEVSDVANAVYEHCDAVMLSGETAVGVNPTNVIKVMTNICLATDKHLLEIYKESRQPRHPNFPVLSRAISFCKAADQVARENNAKALMAFTSSGSTPLIASKTSRLFPIIAPTDNPTVLHKMSIYRGVIPMMMPVPFNDIYKWTDMINLAVEQALTVGLLSKGDVIVVTAGIPIGKSNGINSIRIITV